MSETPYSYQCVLRIPVDNLAAGLTHKSQLDEQIKMGIESVLPGGAKLDCQTGSDAPGGLNASVIRNGQSISVTGRYGQNTVFTGGRKTSFVSYSIRAELVSTALERVDAWGEQSILWGKIIGAVVVPLPLIWAIFAFAAKWGLLIIWVLPLVLGVKLGIWCGGKAGESMARRLENRVHNRSVDSGVADETASFWKRLIDKIESIGSHYEKV
jgi:hypothetical protein